MKFNFNCATTFKEEEHTQDIKVYFFWIFRSIQVILTHKISVGFAKNIH